MDFSTWFDRCVGDWRSYRRYLNGNERAISNSLTDFSIRRIEDNVYTLNWADGNDEGQQRLILDGSNLSLDRNHFDIERGLQANMTRVDDDTVKFDSSFGGLVHYEEVRILGEHDQFRIRTVLAFQQDTNRVMIAGQYFEYRA